MPETGAGLRGYRRPVDRDGCDQPPDRAFSGFLLGVSLPPNQAVSQESQRRINVRRNQVPEYRDTHRLIIKKTKSLLRTLTGPQIRALNLTGKRARFLTCDARKTPEIPDDTVQLTVTSPPFLDIVQYRGDNWLRCWFNGLESDAIGKIITMARTVDGWKAVMADVFCELYRVTAPGGWVAFEVGEVRKGTVRLEEHVVPLGITARVFLQSGHDQHPGIHQDFPYLGRG